MAIENATTDNLNFADFEGNKIPSGINVLSILTFIGSGFALIMSLITPWFIKFMMNFIDKSTSGGVELTTQQLEEIAKSKKSMELMSANMYPIMLVGIIGAVLCIAGAIMMRKLKKDGFWIYTGGELLPIIAGFVLMGTGQYNGVTSYFVGLGVPALFIILYAMQRKHLIR